MSEAISHGTSYDSPCRFCVDSGRIEMRTPDTLSSSHWPVVGLECEKGTNSHVLADPRVETLQILAVVSSVAPVDGHMKIQHP